jgi:hypothetical protein
MDVMTAPAVPLAADLTADWLTAALGLQVDLVDSEVVGTGQMGSCHRLRLTGDPMLPATVLAKIPSEDAGTRELMAGAYVNEIRFYTDLASTVDIKVPHCYYAAVGEAGTFTLLLEDLAPAQVGEQIGGCTPQQALGAVVNLAGLHGPRWCDPTLMEIEGMSSGKEMGEMLALNFPSATENFVDVLGDQMQPEDLETLQALAPLAGRWIAARADRFALLHMDYRLDNLLFDLDGDGVNAVDWQSMSIGLPGRDVAFFLSTGLVPEDRREHEQAIVAAYHQKLLAYGVDGYSANQCWDDYRFGMLQNPFITVLGCVYGTRTERGDRMFLAMIERGCAAIRDHDVFSLIATEPEPS